MFVFGHMGIGSKLVSPWTRRLKLKWVLAGTLFPDLIDKPLYYGMSWVTGKRGLELGLISGTRTVGHTAILLLVITAIAMLRRSRVLAALALGIASHLMLDNLGDRLLGVPESSAFVAMIFPLMGFRFAEIPFADAAEHLASFGNTYTWVTELGGLGLLFWESWKHRHESEILTQLQLRRRLKKLRRIQSNERRPKAAPPKDV